MVVMVILRETLVMVSPHMHSGIFLHHLIQIKFLEKIELRGNLLKIFFKTMHFQVI